MNEKLVWVGPRASDIENDSTFSNSVTTYGTNNYSYCSKIRTRRGTNDEKKFIEQALMELDGIDSDTYFMLYDQSELEQFSEKICSKIICTNEPAIVKLLNSKEFTRAWLSNDIHCLPFIVMPFSDCNYVQLCRLFPGVDSFVLQNTYGVGGIKTYLVKSNPQIETIKKCNNPYDVCIISPFLKNSISLNIHILCSEEKYILFPYSTQIIEQYKHSLLYAGNDFTREYDLNICNKIIESSIIIAKKLINLGYIGVAGIDFMWSNGILYFTEINPRFQGSTRVLNLWLLENGFPSIYKMNIDAFSGLLPTNDFCKMKIPYISYNYMYDVNGKFQPSTSCNLVTQDFDGWNPKIKGEKGVYMTRSIHKIIQ